MNNAAAAVVNGEPSRYWERNSLVGEAQTIESGSTCSEVMNNANGKSCERNREKREKKRLKKQKKKKALTKPGCSFIYMFTSILGGGYVLYRIDYALLNKIKLSDKQEDDPVNLLPLLVFPRDDVLPKEFCTLVNLGDYLYFVGQKPSEVFRIAKHKIKNLVPSEKNLGSVYLRKMMKPSMRGPKTRPIVFVANDNLYVISSDYSYKSHDFEMYSPTTNSWNDMSPKLQGYGDIKSHFVLDDTVYFATKPTEDDIADESVLSCHLTDGEWRHLSTSPKYGKFYDIHPAFDPPVMLIGDMLVGGFIPPPDNNIMVAASPHTRLTESTVHMFMRPSFAPDHGFWPQFFRRFHFIQNEDYFSSHYMTDLQTLDGQNVLCFVSYGYSAVFYDPLSTYALFTFFKITGDCRVTPPEPVEKEEMEGGDRYCYYARQVQGGMVVKSYFNIEFMHRKLLKITTTKISTAPGKVVTCFSN